MGCVVCVERTVQSWSEVESHKWKKLGLGIPAIALTMLVTIKVPVKATKRANDEYDNSS